MKSTSLSVQFTVNDLSASYEVLGSSDNYSFQYKLGQGNDLVDVVGETAVKIVFTEITDCLRSKFLLLVMLV